MAKSVWHRLTGVSEGGHFIPDDTQRSTAVLKSLGGQRVEVAIRAEVKDRTLPQNALLHVLARLISDHNGDSMADVKADAVVDTLGFEAGTRTRVVNGQRVLIARSTADLSVAECSAVVDKLKDICAFLEIPLPAERDVEVLA